MVGFIKRHRTIKLLHVFRKYSSFIVVVSSAILVSVTNLAAGHETSGFLFGYFGTEDDYGNPLADKLFLNSEKKTTLALAPIIETKIILDPTIKAGEEKNDDEDSVLFSGNSVIAENSPVLKDPEEEGGVLIYEVKDGDTIGSIAMANNISTNTILWANEIDNIDSIMPGDKLFILPVSGLSYTVKKGDSLDSIAKEYKANKEKIIAFNMLPANEEIEEGEEIIIPDGQKEVPQPAPAIIAPRQYEDFNLNGQKLSGNSKNSHRFPYGYCTWYVAQKKYVPWSGNAGTWLYKAKSAGYATGKTPRVGAIMVSSESWWGHVAIVESVSGDSFTVSEMNYKGWGKRSTRTINKNNRVIKGFIY